jgi:hypothetical protein
MIHHMSFGVQDTDRVAHVLAELLGATAVRAPTPPFPYGAWLVILGDAHGSFLEILPATTVLDPDAPLGMVQRPGNRGIGSAHVLVGTPLPAEAIQEVASREGWRAQEVETGLFKIIKLWVEDNVLVELITPDEQERYIAAFGADGMTTIDGKLRDLEASLADALAQKLPAKVLEDALGTP